MFLTRKLLKKGSPEERGGFALILIGIVIVAAIGLNIYQRFQSDELPSLLTEAPGLVEVNTLEEANARSAASVLNIPLPKNTSIAAIGVYTVSSQHFPSGSVATALSRSEARFLEVTQKPKAHYVVELERFDGLPTEELALDANHRAALIRTGDGRTECTYAGVDPPIRMCEITSVLLFETEDAVVIIGNDAGQATDGELISLATSILAANE